MHQLILQLAHRLSSSCLANTEVCEGYTKLISNDPGIHTRFQKELVCADCFLMDVCLTILSKIFVLFCKGFYERLY